MRPKTLSRRKAGIFGILGLLITRSFKVESIGIDHPSVLVRQMADGRWNVQEVVELIRRASGGKAADEPASLQPKGVPQLPAVTISEATIRLVDRAGREATLGPLTVRGAPDGPLVWKFDAATPDRMHVAGEIAPGGDWSHRATVSVRNLGPLINVGAALFPHKATQLKPCNPGAEVFPVSPGDPYTGVDGPTTLGFRGATKVTPRFRTPLEKELAAPSSRSGV